MYSFRRQKLTLFVLLRAEYGLPSAAVAYPYHSIRPELIWSWRKDTFVIESLVGHDRVGWSYERQNALDHLSERGLTEKSEARTPRPSGEREGPGRDRPRGVPRRIPQGLTRQKSSPRPFPSKNISFAKREALVVGRWLDKDARFGARGEIRNLARVNSCRELGYEKENHAMNSLESFIATLETDDKVISHIRKQSFRGADNENDLSKVN